MTLPQLEQITDYAEEAATRPLEQYQDRPRMLAWFLSGVHRCQELEAAAWDVMIKRMIDYATAAQLDTIGKIVGQSRNGQTDDLYRIYITARIRINRSQGHPDDVIEVLQLIEAAHFLYTEFYPASVHIEYTEPAATPSLTLLALAQLAAAAGVRVYLIDGGDDGTGDDDGFLLGGDTPGGEIDPDHGLSDEAQLVGGNLAGIW